MTVNNVYPQSLSLSNTSLTIEEGQTSQLQATIVPSYTTYYAISWTSSNTAVATVDNSGNVTAVGEGTATITCQLNMSNPTSGPDPYMKTATCAVTVTKPEPQILTIQFADAEVKRLCVANWDTDGDGELSYEEAAAVTDLGTIFMSNRKMNSFDELQYFTGLTNICDFAFAYCIPLTSIIIPENVTTIGDQAFWQCSSLTSITIPKNVSSISYIAFGLCKSMNSVFVEEGNTTYDCRNNCNAIIETARNKLIVGCKNTIIPNDVESLDSYAFYGLDSLYSITIPSSVVNISCLFRSCKNLETIIVESGNPVYDSRGNCNAIIKSSTNVLIAGCNNTVIPEDVTGIGGLAFDSRNKLIKMRIPESVTSIGSYAFEYCTSLDSIEIPGKLEVIGARAFWFCLSLTSINIPSSVTTLGSGAFENCNGLTSVTVNIRQPLSIDANTFTNRTNATLYVPVGCEAAYRAAPYWSEFKEIVELESLAIDFADAEVKRLCVANWDTSGDGEFSYEEAAAVTDFGAVFKNNRTIKYFNELQYFTGLNRIGDYAFLHCIRLENVTLPVHLKSIGSSAFWNCRNLTSINIPQNVTIIENSAFANCISLSSITVNENNTHFDSRGNCNAIIATSTNNLIAGCKNTVIPNDVVSLDEYAFYGCEGLVSLNISKNLTSIGTQTFRGCKNLDYIVVESGNPVYDDRGNCNAIIETASNKLIAGSNNTVIPDDVSSIGNCALGRERLVLSTVPASVKAIGENSFGGCSGITSMVIPGSVKSLAYGAFMSCINMASLTILPGLETIGNSAFSDCQALVSVEIPSSVTTIGSRAFECRSLTSVTVNIRQPLSIDANTFTNRANATLYVPYGCKAAYEAAPYWSEFKEIVEMENENPYTDLAAYDNVIYVDEATVKNGAEATLSVKMNNTLGVRGFQFDIVLPEGVTAVTDEDGLPLVSLSTERTTAKKMSPSRPMACASSS